MDGHWTEGYYDTLEFFFWEPQHLGKKKNPESPYGSLPQVQKHLHSMEVTLNHQFDLFFRLAPKSMRNELFRFLFNHPFPEAYAYHGRGVEQSYGMDNVSQPDVYFTGPSSVVGIELKIQQKTSIDQLSKYAILGLAEELRCGYQKAFYLALVGPEDFGKLWRSKGVSIAEIKEVLADPDLPVPGNTRPLDLELYETRYREIRGNMEIAFRSYAEIAGFLKALRPVALDRSPGEEVYLNLLEGLIQELSDRGLC